MPRRHGREAIEARKRREADEISRRALNPENRAALERILQEANKQFAAGERQFDSFLFEDEAGFFVGPAWPKPAGADRTLRASGLSAWVVPGEDGRPVVKLKLLSRIDDDSKLIRVPPQNLLSDEGESEWLSVQVRRGRPHSAVLEEFDAVYRIFGDSLDPMVRRTSPGKLSRNLRFYMDRVRGLSVAEIAEKASLSKSGVRKAIASIISRFELPEPTSHEGALEICRQCNGNEIDLCAECPVGRLLEAVEPSLGHKLLADPSKIDDREGEIS